MALAQNAEHDRAAGAQIPGIRRVSGVRVVQELSRPPCTSVSSVCLLDILQTTGPRIGVWLQASPQKPFLALAGSSAGPGIPHRPAETSVFPARTSSPSFLSLPFPSPLLLPTPLISSPCYGIGAGTMVPTPLPSLCHTRDMWSAATSQPRCRLARRPELSHALPLAHLAGPRISLAGEGESRWEVSHCPAPWAAQQVLPDWEENSELRPVETEKRPIKVIHQKRDTNSHKHTRNAQLHISSKKRRSDHARGTN